jgi:hypothetical protein
VRGAAPRVACVLLGCAAARAPAQVPAAKDAPPKIRVLATTRGTFAAFGEPSASQKGDVAFHATRKDGREGIYTSSGGTPSPIVLAGDPVPDGAAAWVVARLGRRPTLSGAAGCAFTVEFEGGGKAVLASRGFGFEPEFVADSGEAFRSFGEDALLDLRGNVLFHALLDPPRDRERDEFVRPESTASGALPEDDANATPPVRRTFAGRAESFHHGLFLEDANGRLTLVAGTQEGFLDLTDEIALNASGAVAFVASVREKHWTLFSTTGSTLLEVAETGEEWSAFHRPAMSPDGHVALVVEKRDGAPAVARVPKGGGAPSIVADATGGFTAIGPNVAIDDAGTIAFVAEREDVGGLYLADPGAAPRLVVPIGTAAGSDAIAAFRLSNRAFGRARQLFALVALDPDGQAIVSIELAGK